MSKKDFTFIISIFLVWRIITIVFALISPNFFPLQNNFLGGGIQNYLKAPWFWGWINFDGEHYMSIARLGYLPLTYFYFPLYPLIVRILSLPFHLSFHATAVIGVVMSNILLIISLLGLWKLLSLDYSKDIVQMTLILLLLFPTSFYLGSFYTESLFLAIIVWGIYFARKRSWILMGILGGLSSATRIIGLALIPAFFFEIYKNYRKRFTKASITGLILAPVGIIVYMIYLKFVSGDYLEFFNNVGIFGEQRQAALILLPRVFYRYIFKILPAINYSYLPIILSTYLEFITGLLFLILVILAFIKLRLSYAVYLFFGYIIPTFAGSFSSLPRYVLVLFPGFLLAAIYISKYPKILKVTILTILFLGLAIASMLFIRGYWIA
jgi:Gpi18-like mannosyltransferase